MRGNQKTAGAGKAAPCDGACGGTGHATGANCYITEAIRAGARRDSGIVIANGIRGLISGYVDKT